jgi:ribosome-binding protein aMBF1 (putative translation factor)
MQAVKYCNQCGRVIAYEATADYYSYISLKYCRPCAQDVHRRQIADSMRKARAAARERRNLEKVQTAQTSKENELLRQIIREQAARIADLKTVLENNNHD